MCHGPKNYRMSLIKTIKWKMKKYLLWMYPVLDLFWFFSGADNSPVFSVASIFSELSRDSPSFCLWHAMLQSATMASYPLKAFMESCSRLWDTNYNFRHKHSTKYEDVLWLSLFYLWSTCVQRLSIIRQQLVVVFEFSEDPQTMRPEQKVLVLPAPLQYLILWSEIASLILAGYWY